MDAGWRAHREEVAARVPLTQHAADRGFPGATYYPATDAVFAQLDIGGYNYNLAENQQRDHERVPGRIMMTIESMAQHAFEQWQLVHDHAYTLANSSDGDGLPRRIRHRRLDLCNSATGRKADQMMQQMMPNMGAMENPFEHSRT